jgi:deazaflavin-dependent oxidoreductase (nitroreductase family)
MPAFNDTIIEEFRSNGGRVGGPFTDMQLLLLTTTGRHSGQRRTSPVAYSMDDSRYVIAASNAGSDQHPLWFRNLQADPHASIEVSDQTVGVRASMPSDTERDRLYAAHATLMPGFADYEKATTRTIPIVVLEPAPSPT